MYDAIVYKITETAGAIFVVIALGIMVFTLIAVVKVLIGRD